MPAIFAASIAAGGDTQKTADKTENSAATETEKAASPENIKAAGQVDESYRYYPAYIGNILYLKAFKKSEPGKPLFVKVRVIGKEQKDDGEYLYFSGPKVKVRYLMGIDKKDGIYMRVIKYPFPLFGLSIEIDIKPKMQILRFPLKAGDRWHYEGKAKAHLLIIPMTRNIKADFVVVEKVALKTLAGDIDTYHLKVELDSGDGKGTTTEHYWYAKDIGYSVADTSEHRAETTGYRIFNEQEGRWIEKLPENPEKYE